MAEVDPNVMALIKKVQDEQLEELDLSGYLAGSPISSIPSEVFSLEHLKILKISSQKIHELPTEISRLKNLEKLYVFDNPIGEIPEWLDGLAHLQSFGFSFHNGVSPKVDAGLNQLSDLQIHEISSEDLPAWLLRLTQLKELTLWGGPGQAELPRNATRLRLLGNITKLVLGSFRITELPNWIRYLTAVSSLYFYNCPITDLPEWLPDLQELSVVNGGIGEWPRVTNRLERTKVLNFTGNRIAEIPDGIARLQLLESLRLTDNRLSRLPDGMTGLRCLKTIYLGGNKIGQLPDWLFDLPDVEMIDFSSNRIRKIDPRLLEMKHLLMASFRGNPLEDPPIEVAEKGLAAIREYYRQRAEEGIDHLYEAKLLILGEGGAGKTTLAKKIHDANYELKEEDTTKGIEVTQWSFPLKSGQDFRVNIWDFGGQEIYHATHQFFLTRRSLYAIVADDRKEDTDFNYWLQVVELLSDKSPVLIIENEKQDRKKEINESALRGRFDNLMEILETNLATNRGLANILKAIQSHMERLPHVGAALPKNWVRVREALESDPRNYISLEEYLKVCEQNGFTNEQDMLQLSGYLHDIGVFLHFQDDPLLRQTVILKPRWGTDAVYHVLEDKTVRNNWGTFTRQDVARIWSDRESARKRDELLQLMMKFHLCYQVPYRTDTYIAPHLLSAIQPKYDWESASNLHLRYVYEFMPKGILTQFIVLMNRYIRGSLVWKSGVVLEKDGALAEVIENYDKKEIRVRVAGRNKKTLLDLVDHHLEEIHGSYRQLRYDTSIPCNCVACLTAPEPYFYALKELNHFINSGEPTIQCRKSFKMIEVNELVYDIINWRRPEAERRAGEPGYNIRADVVNIQQIEKAESVSASGPIESRHIKTNEGAYIEGDARVGGDFVNRDKITFESAFDRLREEVARVADTGEREELTATVEKLEKEASKGDSAGENKVRAWFRFLAEMAPDIGEVAVNTFANPIAGVSTVFKRVAERAKEERKK